MTKKGQGRAKKAPPSRAVSARLKTKVVALLAENPEMKAADVALELRVSRPRAQAYMTKEVRAEAKALSKVGDETRLEDIDRAMMKQARLGNVQAARLVYMRMAQKGEALAVPTLEELEAELASLKKLERVRETQNDTSLDDAAAVADDACR